MATKTRTSSFKTSELRHQRDYFEQHFAAENGFRGAAHRLMPKHAQLNLLPATRENARACFAAAPAIKWHAHANHGLSSQVCCVNFLMPLADKPQLLAQWIGHVLDAPPPEMLPVEHDRAGRDWYVAFEWIGDTDYLNEANARGARSRGANATAADAAVKFRAANGDVHLLLIEWKYTESYRGHALSEDRRGTRIKRYSEIAFAPHGPMRTDRGLSLQDFFYEPFYQLLRQQMLAWHVQHDPASGIDRARVLHLSPSGNAALHHVTSPPLANFGSDAFAVFQSLLVEPADFIAMPIERALHVSTIGQKPPGFNRFVNATPACCPWQTAQPYSQLGSRPAPMTVYHLSRELPSRCGPRASAATVLTRLPRAADQL